MKKGIFLIVLSLVLTIFVQASEVQKVTVPPVATVSINGVIADVDTDETLAGVMVSIEGTGYKTLTDLDGNFSFDGLESGDYDLKLTYISYKEVKVENVKTDSKDQTIELKLKSE